MATAGKSGDGRSRAVVSVSQAKLGLVELHLECGHVQRRRFTFEQPTRVICRDCGDRSRETQAQQRNRG